MKKYHLQKIMTVASPPRMEPAFMSWSEKLSKAFGASLLLYDALPAAVDAALQSPQQMTISNNRLKAAMTRLRDIGSRMENALNVRCIVEMTNNWRSMLKQMQSEKADLLITTLPDQGVAPDPTVFAALYNSPSAQLFLREQMLAPDEFKILIPIRLKTDTSQIIPVVAAWAHDLNAAVCVSAFQQEGQTPEEKLQLNKLLAKTTAALRAAGIKVRGETAHGIHFGSVVLESVKRTKSNLLTIAVQPEFFKEKEFAAMIGPYFLENADVPVLAVPVQSDQTVAAQPALGAATFAV